MIFFFYFRHFVDGLRQL